MSILPRIATPLALDAKDKNGKEIKVGNRVEHLDGSIGTVKSILQGMATVRMDDGDTRTVYTDKLIFIR